MSLHSYSRVWVHLVWATLERRPLLTKAAAAKLSTHLTDYAAEKEIYMKINFVNPDHVHALVDLPTSLSVEEMMQLFKGASSHWINQKCIGSWQVRMGARLWDILRLSLGPRRGGQVHCRAGGASSQAKLRR
jgi:REP element-mobilizing transposase RayT